MSSTLDQIRAGRLIQTVSFTALEQAVPTAQALKDGGMLAIEVLNRGPLANTCEAIRLIVANVPGMLVGAGTITSLPGQAGDPAHIMRQLQKAGAKFFASPYNDPAVSEAAGDTTCPFFLGAFSHTEVAQVACLRFPYAKIYPMNSYPDGVKHLQHLHDIFPQMEFVASGGIDVTRMPAYFQLRYLLAINPSGIVTPALLRDKDFAGIRMAARTAVRIRDEHPPIS